MIRRWEKREKESFQKDVRRRVLQSNEISARARLLKDAVIISIRSHFFALAEQISSFSLSLLIKYPDVFFLNQRPVRSAIIRSIQDGSLSFFTNQRFCRALGKRTTNEFQQFDE